MELGGVWRGMVRMVGWGMVLSGRDGHGSVTLGRVWSGWFGEARHGRVVSGVVW